MAAKGMLREVERPRAPETGMEATAARPPWDLSHAPRVPVARPRLAALESALPYLRRIDAARTYSNFGPLNALLELRLCERFSLGDGAVVTSSSGTTGLTLALMAAAGERDGESGLCLMPAWTFAATALAASAAGLRPFLADVDPVTGALTPEIAARALMAAPGRVTAIVAVAPFGLPLDIAAWDAFSARTGVPVVIDAAAGFDGLKPGRSAAVVSLHATKVLGVGEGGFVVSTDPLRIADIRRRSSFGFHGSRESAVIGINGKLSEYAAAYGLAGLDMWKLQRAEYQAIQGYYRAALRDLPGLSLAPGLGDDWICSTFNIEASPAAILQIERDLARVEIASRRWWGDGLQSHRAFQNLPRTALRTTERLAASTLGLPCWPGLGVAEIDEVVAIVTGVLRPG
jgi:dTDP-4-amino-4,6-dideoxygalactose transaminase